MQVNLEKWSPSPSSTVKLNVDASVNGGGSGVLGGIMRDANGEVVGTAYLFMERAWGVEEMEAGAVRWESKIASEMRIDKLMVETDCQQVAWALKHKKNPRTQAGRLISDCLNIVASFKSVCFEFAKRNCNRVAQRFHLEDPKL